MVSALFKNLLGTNSFNIFMANKGASLHSFRFQCCCIVEQGALSSDELNKVSLIT